MENKGKVIAVSIGMVISLIFMQVIKHQKRKAIEAMKQLEQEAMTEPTVAEASKPVQPQPKFDKSEAYQLRVKHELSEYASAPQAEPYLRDAFLQKLLALSNQVGINPDSGPLAGEGYFGAIDAVLLMDYINYKSSNKNHSLATSVPKSLKLTLNVESFYGSSSWDGQHTYSATVDTPTSIVENQIDYYKKIKTEALIDRVLEQAQQEIGRFSRN